MHLLPHPMHCLPPSNAAVPTLSLSATAITLHFCGPMHLKVRLAEFRELLVKLVLEKMSVNTRKLLANTED